MKKIIFFIIVISRFFSYAQVEVKVDTTHIRIGEQIQYELFAPKEAHVTFPKLQLDSLNKVEVVYALPVDTLKEHLYKKYILTSFDSGVYRIPAQDILIDKQHYFTDSLLIHVGTVTVDTTKQKLYPLKGIYKAQPKTWRDYIHYLWWIVGIVLLATIIWGLLSHFRKVRKKATKPVLTPIEVALQNFNNLDEKQLINQQKIKEYYIELTDIVRSYIGEDVKIPTLEVTTDELITLLSLHNKSNKLGIDKERIKELHLFLKEADLVKFAKYKPEIVQIQEDRRIAETIINEIQIQINQPIFDEKGNEIILETKAEIAEKNKKKQRNTYLLLAGILAVLILLGSLWYFGYTYVKDTLVGHPTKELLEGKWYQSSYGYPAIGIETPRVLKAAQNENKQIVMPVFSYGSLFSDFFIQVTTLENTSEEEITLDMVIDGMVRIVEEQEGISNFSYGGEELSVDGIVGKKLNGNFKIRNEKMQFNQYVFLTNNAIQVLLIEYKENDTYAKRIVKRIEKSIQLEKITTEKEE